MEWFWLGVCIYCVDVIVLTTLRDVDTSPMII